MEDIDRPRAQPGAAAAIVETLSRYGLTWDEPIVRQSERGAHYQRAFDQLAVTQRIYPCACSRKEIADSVAIGGERPLTYPGTCRAGLAPGKTPRAWRIQVPDETLRFADRVLGLGAQALADEVGDFILFRADGIWAYQLAVVVDDHEQQITHVVRGADLIDSTARQMFLQRCLGYRHPEYAHVPVVLNDRGEKLSKQTGALALDDEDPLPALAAALRFLRHDPPPAAQRSLTSLWSWAIEHWDLKRLQDSPSTSHEPTR